MLYFLDIPNILLVILALSLGLYGFVKNPKSRLVQVWFAVNMAVTAWAVGYILTNYSVSNSQAFICLKIVYFAASLIPILFFHFVSSFLFKNYKYRILIYIGYISALFFLILNVLTNHIISGIRFMENYGSYEEIETKGFYFFLIYFFFFSFFSIGLLWKGYKESSGVRKRQIFYIALAALVGFLGGTSNFFTDLTGIYPYGQFVVWLYPLFITYGMYIDEIQIKIKF